MTGIAISNLSRTVLGIMLPHITRAPSSPLALSLIRSGNRPSKLMTGLTQKTCFSIGNSLLRRIRIDLKKDSAQSIDKKLNTLITRQNIRNDAIIDTIACKDYKTMGKLLSKTIARGKQLNNAITKTGIDHPHLERLNGLYQQPYEIIDTYLKACDILRDPKVNQITALTQLISTSHNEEAIYWAFKNHDGQVWPLSEELDAFIAGQQSLPLDTWAALAILDASIENH